MTDKQPDEAFVIAHNCPNCGSSNLRISPLGPVTCLSCAWQGTQEQLVAFASTAMTQQQHDLLVEGMARSLREMLSKNLAPVLLQFLVKWGFMDQAQLSTPQFQKDFLTYLNNIGHDLTASIVRTRAEIDQRAVARREASRVG